MDIKQTLLDFHNTLKSSPEISDDELLNKFPQIGKDNLSAAFDYSATLDSGKYKIEDEFVDKFPEFFPVKKKEEPVDGGTLPEVVVTASKQSSSQSPSVETAPTQTSASSSSSSPSQPASAVGNNPSTLPVQPDPSKPEIANGVGVPKEKDARQKASDVFKTELARKKEQLYTEAGDINARNKAIFEVNQSYRTTNESPNYATALDNLKRMRQEVFDVTAGDSESRNSLIQNLREDAKGLAGFLLKDKNAISNWQSQGLNPAQGMALDFMQVFEPEKYKAYQERATATTSSEAAGVGKQIVNFELENVGLNILKTGLGESNQVIQERIEKSNKGELTADEQAKLKSDYVNLNKWIEYVNKLEQDQYTKYPEAVSLEVGRIIQDVDKPTLGQGGRAVFNFANSISGSIESGLNSAYAGVFLNDEEKINNDLEVLAKTGYEGDLTYTTQDQSLFNRPFLTTVSDDVKAKINEINKSSLSDEEKYKQKFELLKQARKDGNIYSVVNPNKSKVNWTGEAMLNTVTSVAPQVVGAIVLSGASGGFGATTKAGQLANLFAVTASQSYGQRYNQAIQEGTENPYFEAAAGTLIDAGTELFGNNIAQIKKVFSKGAAGKILDRLSEADWKRLMANKTNAFRNFGKVALDQGKDVFVESFVEEGAANELENALKGRPMGEGFKETVLSSSIGFLPLKIIGLPMVFRNANMVDKLNLYSAGFNKISTTAAIDNQLKTGEINKEEADRRKGIVNQMNGIVNTMPMFDAKGNPLSDEKKATYAFNQYIKLNSKDTDGLPASTVNSINQTAQEADAANGAILEGQPDVKPADKTNPDDLPEVTVTGVKNKATDLPEVTVAAGKRLFNEPDPETEVIIQEYKKQKGIDTPEGAPITKLDENRSKSIADAFDAMENNPNDPEVKASYEAMSKETKDQYDALIKSGMKVEIYEGEGEPYKNSEEMIKDVRENNHLFVLSTEKDFGQNPITDQQRNDNPLLRDSGAKDINGKPLLNNDVFRAVHDRIAHGGRGNAFGPIGEENAWDVHARMYTPLARRAMTTETRGQNSWVNFGKHMRNTDGSIKKKGDEGFLSARERPFAEQKMGLLPEEFSNIEDNYTKKSPQFEVTATTPVDLPNVTVKSPIHKKVIADVNQAAKTLASSGIKFKIYDNAESFATESGQDKSTQGVFVDEDGTVSINLDAIKNSKDWNIAWHESSHPVMNIIRNTNKPLYDKMAKGLSDLAKTDKNAAAIVNWSENNYEGKETQVDEAVVESIALMADGTIDFDNVPLGTRQALIDFINEIAKYLGLDPILSETSKATFIKKAKEISNALKTGTDISTVVGEKNVSEFKNNIGENVGEPTQLRVGDPDQGPVEFKPSYPLSFVKPEDKIDIKSLIDDIQTKGQKVWFWVADQLGRGNYYDSVIDGEHYLDAGPSFALDPENRKQNVIWATGKGEKFINDNIKKSDYLFIISGSPSKSKLFNKNVADITIQRLKGVFNGDYAKFKAKMNSVSKITGLNNIINEFNSFEDLLDSPKRKDFLIAIDDQKEKKGTDLKKFLDENKLFVDYESLRDGFYKDNGFDMNDIMLVLKPTKMGGVSKHSTYQNNVLGDVVGVPDKKINAYDIMTPEFRAKYPELKSKTQQSQTVAPYGSGIKGVASPIKENVVGLPDVTVTSTKKQQKVGKVELPAATQKQMTEDDKGNYLFYHYSDKNIKTINPDKFGSNTRATGRDERPGVGISMYYTRPDVIEGNVPNDYGYVVRVPKGKVYPFNQDPLNLIEPAKRMFEKQYPGQAFDPNKQVAWVSKAAAGRGYPMTVAEWNIGRRKLVRAQTTEALKPEKYSNIVPGSFNQVNVNPELAKFQPNAKKRGQAKIGGGLSLEDLKEFNKLPNIDLASGDNYVPLSKFGITSVEGENVKTISEKLAEFEGPFQPIFKAISNLPNADKVKMYDLGQMENIYNSAGGEVAGLYSMSRGLFGKPKIGISTEIYANQYSAVAHEMMHWVTLESVNKYKNTPEYKSLENIYNFLKAKHPDIVGSKASGSYYGLQNFEEFMAELLTNKDFRDNMSGVMAKDAKEFEKTSYANKTKDIANNADLITLLIDYVTRTIKDMMDSWGKKSGNIDFSKPIIDNATDLAVKAYFGEPLTGKPSAQRRAGGLSLEDLKDYNNLPNIEMASNGTRVKLSDLGVDLSKKKYNLKTISTELSKVEGPYQPLFKALANMPKSEKVRVYDFYGKENPITGGVSSGLYIGQHAWQAGQIGVRSVGNEYAILAHEAMHWVTWDSINKQKGTPEYKSLERIYDFVRGKKRDRIKRYGYWGNNYGLSSFSEFMAEILVNKDFRDGIADVMAENEKEFKDYIYSDGQKNSGDFITTIVNYVSKVLRDYFNTWARGIDFNKSMLDNATDLAVKAYFAGVPSGGPQLSSGSANVDADTRKSVANMLDKLSDEDIAKILMDEKGLTEEEAMDVIEDVKYDPSLNPSVSDIVGEVGEGERARGLSKTFPDRGVDTIAKINSDAKKYFVVSNKQTAEEAQAFIDDKNPEDALDYLLTQPTDIPNRVRIWMSGAVMDKIDTAINAAQLAGDTAAAQRLSDKQAQLVNQVAPLGTELGQAIQAFRRFYENSKGSPSMLQFYIKKITDQVESEKGKPLTDEERQNIVDLAKNVQSADEGLPKDEATYALGNYVSTITPVAATDIMEAIWYAHILSGITTQSTNFFANLWNSFAEGAVVGTRESIKTKSVMPFLNGIKGFLSGIKQGANDAADIIKTGVTKQDGDKFKQGNILEFFSWKQVVGNKAGKVLDWAGGYSPKILKYVGRALAATDAAFSRANSEAISRVMAYNIAQEEGKTNPDLKINKRVDELLNKTAEKKAEAQEKAKAEGYLEGTTRYRRRVGEIMEAGRSKELRKEADEFGKRVTLNYEPEGFMRPVYKLALALQQSTKLTRMFIPFTRIVVNLTENALNYTPLGFVKTAVGSTTTDTTLKGNVRRKLTPDERADFAIKATIGLSTFVLLSGLTGEDDDDLFEITANGSGNKQKNYELMKSGWRPYSIKTKDGRYISYKDWPIAPVLAAVGAMHDSGKYNSSDEPTNEATIAAQAMVVSLYDKSVMKGLQDFVEIIDPKEEYNQSTKMFDRLKNWGADQARTMAVSNFTQQAFKFSSEAMDNPIKASKGVERIYRDIPYLNDGLNPILDVFGEPVKPSTSERLLPITLGKPSKDQVLAAFNENGVYIGKPKTRPLFLSSDPSNEETRPMTDQEYYQFTKRSGQITKEIIMEEWDEIKKILAITDKKKRRAELKDYMSKLIGDAREEAFYEFPNQE